MNKKDIYGIINIPIGKYSPPTTSFETSNIKQVLKLLKENINIYIALCVAPEKNAYKEALIKEIVKITNAEDINNYITTGYGIVNCESVFLFNDLANNREYFNIRPHGQWLIKQISEQESNNIIKYIQQIKKKYDE